MIRIYIGNVTEVVGKLQSRSSTSKENDWLYTPSGASISMYFSVLSRTGRMHSSIYVNGFLAQKIGNWYDMPARWS